MAGSDAPAPCVARPQAWQGPKQNARPHTRTPGTPGVAAGWGGGSGVDDDWQCDDGGFKPETVPVAAEAAVERKRKEVQVQRVRPLLSELQVPEWQELAVDRRKRKWRNMSKSTDIVQCHRRKELGYGGTGPEPVALFRPRFRGWMAPR
jgi:hypothetical protein